MAARTVSSVTASDVFRRRELSMQVFTTIRCSHVENWALPRYLPIPFITFKNTCWVASAAAAGSPWN